MFKGPESFKQHVTEFVHFHPPLSVLEKLPMKRIRCWDDLRPFGVDLLTGEACGLSYRLLCDVTEKGRQTVAKALGLKQLPLPDNWNRGDPGDPHVGAIMLAPEMLVPLGIFALLEHGCSEVWQTRAGDLLGIEPSDEPERVASVKRFHTSSDNLVRRFAYAGTAGDRNRHEMSGRVE